MMQLIEQLKNRIRLVVGRALIKAVNSASGDDGLSVDISLPGGEEHSQVPLFQQYGICSRPNKDSEAVVLFVGGARDNGVAVATQGNASKLPSLQDGEVAVFSEYGQTIVLKKDGSIVATTKSGKSFKVNASLEVSGDIKGEGKIEADGNIESATEVKAGIVSLSMHKHIAPSGGGSTSTPT